jgi:SAM-dependent methyltransferase
MYSVSFYGTMIADGPRVDAYVEALRRTVTPDSVVIDLGSGPGFFALLACRFGAKRVYAIEPNNIIELARKSASANGFDDRLICIQDFSSSISLDEPADIIISDLRGILPWFQQHLPAIQDARERLLKPGGTLIPKRDFLWSALVNAPEKYEELTAVWKRDRFDLDFTAGRPHVVNTFTKFRPRLEQLLVEPLLWHTIDYCQVDRSDVTAEMRWQISKPGTAHGFVVWFDSELCEGVMFSNHPSQPELVYGSAFFPFTESIQLSANDEIKIVIQADLVDKDYVWRWNTTVKKADTGLEAGFKQSSFFSVPLSPAQIHKQAAGFIPTANEEGLITAFVLALMDGKSSVEEIAKQVATRFPSAFANSYQALTAVTRLSQRYSHE